ncbi:MAG: restriction endonuclease subunit S [Bryobacterales bacterium]|nr:restriction endonuclease subunit S [Bryobacterales bacterium]
MTSDRLLLLLPKLRFLRFRDCEKWRRRKLGDVIARGKEKFDPQKSCDTPWLIELENIESKTGRILGVSKLEHQKGLKSSFRAGDVLFGKLRPYLQKFARPHFKGVCTSEIWVLRGKELVSGSFLFHLVQTERFIQLVNISYGSRMPRAEWKFIADSDFAIPHLDEQQKIADCLDCLDDLIAAADRKLEALRQHKQGLMQQLFPQPGEAVPKLRFPEFSRAGSWKSEQIKNVARITKGKGIAKADIKSNGAIPCIRYAELYTHYGEVIYNVISSTNIPKKNLILSRAEDVIIPASGETKSDISKAACVLDEGVALGSDLNILRSDLYGPFLSYLLNSSLRDRITRVAQGDTVAHLYPKQISQIWLDYPSRIEQKKIVDFLDSMDGIIAASGRKIEVLRQHKQGLMQQLFPFEN